SFDGQVRLDPGSSGAMRSGDIEIPDTLPGEQWRHSRGTISVPLNRFKLEAAAAPAAISAGTTAAPACKSVDVAPSRGILQANVEHECQALRRGRTALRRGGCRAARV